MTRSPGTTPSPLQSWSSKPPPSAASPSESPSMARSAPASQSAGGSPILLLKAIFILSEGLDVNGSELVRGINSVVPVDVVVTGGLAGDGPRFQQTW